MFDLIGLGSRLFTLITLMVGLRSERIASLVFVPVDLKFPIDEYFVADLLSIEDISLLEPNLNVGLVTGVDGLFSFVSLTGVVVE